MYLSVRSGWYTKQSLNACRIREYIYYRWPGLLKESSSNTAEFNERDRKTLLYIAGVRTHIFDNTTEMFSKGFACGKSFFFFLLQIPYLCTKYIYIHKAVFCRGLYIVNAYVYID